MIINICKCEKFRKKLPLYSSQKCIMYNVHYTMYNLHCTLYTVQCTLYTVYYYTTMNLVTRSRGNYRTLTHLMCSSLSFAIVVDDNALLDAVFCSIIYGDYFFQRTLLEFFNNPSLDEVLSVYGILIFFPPLLD